MHWDSRDVVVRIRGKGKKETAKAISDSSSVTKKAGVYLDLASSTWNTNNSCQEFSRGNHGLTSLMLGNTSDQATIASSSALKVIVHVKESVASTEDLATTLIQSLTPHTTTTTSITRTPKSSSQKKKQVNRIVAKAKKKKVISVKQQIQALQAQV
ncbi:hypothetical protein Tco_1387186 [Tanacetum coccineum]